MRKTCLIAIIGICMIIFADLTVFFLNILRYSDITIIILYFLKIIGFSCLLIYFLDLYFKIGKH